MGFSTYLACARPNFFSPDNLMVILRSVSEQGLIAFGMTMVIVAGEIDLSVGSMVALAGCLAAWLVAAGLSPALAIPAAMALGAGAGAFTGLMRNAFSVPSFITTLALLKALRGAALMLCGGFTLTPSFPAWYQFLGAGYVRFVTDRGELAVPFPVILFLAGFGLVHFLLGYTTFGRAVYAVGGNAEAARLSGVNVGRVRILVLALTGMLAALSGVLVSARFVSGNPNVAEGWELEVIAAVIIGGTSLSGGAGTVFGTLLGVIFIGVISNGMILLDVRPYVQHIVLGAIILAAVLVNQVQRHSLQ